METYTVVEIKYPEDSGKEITTYLYNTLDKVKTHCFTMELLSELTGNRFVVTEFNEDVLCGLSPYMVEFYQDDVDTILFEVYVIKTFYNAEEGNGGDDI